MLNPAFFHAAVAFTIWGCFPVLFDILRFSGPFEIFLHRVIWSAALITPFVLLSKRATLLQLFHTFRQRSCMLSANALIIGSNWLIFVYAVLENRVLETSLGYFMSPIFSILIGLLVFSERLGRYERVALLLMVIALTTKAVHENGLPWISCVLAITFALYGAIHKRSGVPPDISLTIETILLAPFGIAGLYWLAQYQTLAFGAHLQHSLLLMSTGLISITPLWFFILATKKLRLSQIGFLNYLTPSISFLLGLLYFQESLSWLNFFSFLCIWIALICVIVGAFSKRTKACRQAVPVTSDR